MLVCNRHELATFFAYPLRKAMRMSAKGMAMTQAEMTRKQDELDRLLNDPDVQMEPARIWSLLDELAAESAAELSRE
jgi:hypothetical protein